MKRPVLPAILCFVLVAGCAHFGKEPGLTYVPVAVRESFVIGAFIPSETEYNYRHYDEAKTTAFLASVYGEFAEGDVIAVDGLKWRKRGGDWEPVPNPPVPQFDEGGDVDEHVRQFAEWVDSHPHFGYPSIPLNNKE